MGISLKDRRKRRRRSYASYRPAERSQGPRNDPFRIVFYLIVIGAGIWVYFNQEIVLGWLAGQPAEVAAAQPGGSVSQGSAGAPVVNAQGPAAAELAAQAEAAYLEGNLKVAVDYYRQAAALAPEVADYHVQIARLLIYQSAMQYTEIRTETLNEALEAANTAVLVDPYNPAGYAIMGKVYDWQGRPDQASSTILQALDIDANYALAHSYLAESLVDLTRYDQALETIQQALALQPDHVDIRRDYAYILEVLGDYSAAATQYEAALRLHPRLVPLNMALGRVYLVLGRYQEAQDQFFQAQLLDPTSALVPFELGRTFETYIGDPNTALDYYERAVEQDSNFGSAWLRIGTLRYFQGRYADAIVALERALALNRTHQDVYYQLGLSYAYEGRCDTAIRYLMEAQEKAEGDERILDAVETGFEVCAQPTPLPADVLGTQTPSAEDTP